MKTPANSSRVLVVEDDAALSEVVCTFLGDEGYTCVPAFSGTEALLHAERAGKKSQPFDLVILDGEGMSQDLLNSVDSFVAENGFTPRLMVQDPDKLATLHMPTQGTNDFILSTASTAEFELRCTLLLWPGEESAPADIVTIDNMTINLATYQVTIDERPVDLTLMEYSLLSFLATHPSRAYSRETLLHRVWGFEYCGGTRTVDVHIRRVRSKVGPQVASHIVTIRGVGYLFRI